MLIMFPTGSGTESSTHPEYRLMQWLTSKEQSIEKEKENQ